MTPLCLGSVRQHAIQKVGGSPRRVKPHPADTGRSIGSPCHRYKGQLAPVLPQDYHFSSIICHCAFSGQGVYSSRTFWGFPSLSSHRPTHDGLPTFACEAPILHSFLLSLGSLVLLLLSRLKKCGINFDPEPDGHKYCSVSDKVCINFLPHRIELYGKKRRIKKLRCQSTAISQWQSPHSSSVRAIGTVRADMEISY